MLLKTKKQCIICLYTLILSIAAVASTLILPQFDRADVREIAGALTLVGSLGGGIMCMFFVMLMSQGMRDLNARLQEVYYLMLIIFICTASFGILGIMHPPIEAWDLVYNIRAIAVLLEVIALYRFFKCWLKVGSEGNARK